MKFIKNIKIYNTEYTKKRLGPNKDGGYIVLDELCKKCNVLYSYGISDDVSFELDFLSNNPNAKVRLFDHTVENLPAHHKNFSFLKEGVSFEQQSNLNTLENHLKYYGDLNNLNKILKIDVEWNEWNVFEKMPENILSQFDQIFCEFHFIPVVYNGSNSPYFTKFNKFVYSQINDLLFEKYQNVLEKIYQYYHVFHLHINNSLPLNEINGKKFPPLVEMSFINKNLAKNATLIKEKFPIKNLDFANKDYKQDILNFDWNQYYE